MKNRVAPRILFVCVVCFVMMVTVALSQDLALEEAIEPEIVKIAQIRMTVFEDT